MQKSSTSTSKQQQPSMPYKVEPKKQDIAEPAPLCSTNEEIICFLMKNLKQVGESRFGIVVHDGFKLCKSEGLVSEEDSDEIEECGDIISFLNERMDVSKIKIWGHNVENVCHSYNNFVVLPNGSSKDDLKTLVELYKEWRTNDLIGKGSFLGVDVKTCGCS